MINLIKPKDKLVVFYADAHQYHHNCFIAQLVTTLKSQFSVKAYPYSALEQGKVSISSQPVKILSLLKQRNWERAIPLLQKTIGERAISFYDQDPWEAYHDQASSPGVYKRVSQSLNVRNFLVTSNWWAQYISRTDDLPVKFVRMGMLPSYCDTGKKYEDRTIEVGFQGTLHPHRKAFFKRMKDLRVETEYLPSANYLTFLKNLQNICIYLHDEKADVKINGVLSYNGIWVKEIEAAARGCFAIRNDDEDSKAYGIDEIPTVMPFADEREVPDIIENIRSMPLAEKNERMQTAVALIKKRDDWMTVVRAL